MIGQNFFWKKQGGGVKGNRVFLGRQHRDGSPRVVRQDDGGFPILVLLGEVLEVHIFRKYQIRHDHWRFFLSGPPFRDSAGNFVGAGNFEKVVVAVLVGPSTL